MYTTFLLEHLIYMNDNRAKSQLIFFFCKSGWLIRPEVLVDLRKKIKSELKVHLLSFFCWLPRQVKAFLGEWSLLCCHGN